MSTTPQFESAIARIETLTTKWSRLMDMSWLSIRHTFNPNFHEEEHLMVATTQADWEYRAAVVDWHLPRVCALQDDTLESVVVHEYCHILNNPLEQQMAKDWQAPLVEFACESVARALMAVHKNG